MIHYTIMEISLIWATPFISPVAPILIIFLCNICGHSTLRIKNKEYTIWKLWPPTEKMKSKEILSQKDSELKVVVCVSTHSQLRRLSNFVQSKVRTIGARDLFI